jgi:hypothetical protein
MRGLVCTSRDPVQLTRQEPDQMTHQELVMETGLKPLLLPKAQELVILHRRALVLDEVRSILRVKLFKRTSPACRSSSIKMAERGTVPISVYGFADQDPHPCAESWSTHGSGSGSAFLNTDSYRLCDVSCYTTYFSFYWSKKVSQWSKNFTLKHEGSWSEWSWCRICLFKTAYNT